MCVLNTCDFCFLPVLALSLSCSQARESETGNKPPDIKIPLRLDHPFFQSPLFVKESVGPHIRQTCNSPWRSSMQASEEVSRGGSIAFFPCTLNPVNKRLQRPVALTPLSRTHHHMDPTTSMTFQLGVAVPVIQARVSFYLLISYYLTPTLAYVSLWWYFCLCIAWLGIRTVPYVSPPSLLYKMLY